MTPLVRVTDRLLTALLATVLLGGGIWAIAYGSHERHAWAVAARVDAQAIGRVTEWPWWTVVSATAGALVALLGAWVVLLHLRSRAAHALPADGGAIDVARLADAAAQDVGRHPAIQRAKATTFTHRGRPVVRITVGVTPDTTSETIRRVARHCRADVRHAAGCDIAFQLLVEPVRPEKEHETGGISHAQRR